MVVFRALWLRFANEESSDPTKRRTTVVPLRPKA